MITLYIIEFILFSFIGWVIDSTFRSIDDKKLVNAGYFWGPICPIYGLGGVTLVFLFKSFSFLPSWGLILLSSLAMIMVELFGGIFSERVLKVKLWDYSSSRFNLWGHIDLLHSFFWFIMVMVFSFFFFPWLLFLEGLVTVPEYFELPVFLIFVFVSLWLTLRKNPAQFLEIKGKIINMTVEKYQQLFSDIEKMYKTTHPKRREQLLAEIKKQLENTGAYLRKLKNGNPKK